MNTNPNINQKLQDLLNKLMAEEYIANQLYIMFSYKIDKYSDDFLKIAEDELDDHFKNLKKYAEEYGYSFPITLREILKYAGSDATEQYKNIKNNQTNVYYFKESVKSEMAAVKSYKEALENSAIEEIPGLENLLVGILYDEYEHLNKFKYLLNVEDVAEDSPYCIETNNFEID